MSYKVPLFHEWSFPQRMFYYVVKIFIPRAARLLFRLDIHGIEHVNKIPEGTPVIFCGNHQSHLDPVLLGSVVVEPWGSRKALAFMANGKAMNANIFFKQLKRAGAFPVFRESPIPALLNSLRYLRAGYGVYISPQGKRLGRTPYHDYLSLEQEGKTGVGRLVLKMNGQLPIIPFYIHGTGEALRVGTSLPKLKQIIGIRFGKPLLFREFTKQGGWSEKDPEFYSSSRQIVDRIMGAIKEQMGIHNKYYFGIIEKKFGSEIGSVRIPQKVEKQFNLLVTKLAKIPPVQLKEIYDTLYY